MLLSYIVIRGQLFPPYPRPIWELVLDPMTTEEGRSDRSFDFERMIPCERLVTFRGEPEKD